MKSVALATVAACILLSLRTADAFGFGMLGGGGGGGGGCGCGAPPPPPPCGGGMQMPSFQMPQFQMPQFQMPQMPCPPQLPSIPPPQLPSLPSFPSGGGCGCGRKKRDAPTETVASAGLLCTSEKLRQILNENMSADTTESTMNIQKAIFSKIAGNFEVICDKIDFDHVVKSKDFCLESSNGVTCYIYRPL